MEKRKKKSWAIKKFFLKKGKRGGKKLLWKKKKEITIPLGKNGGGGKGEREVSVLECGGRQLKNNVRLIG